MKFISSLIFFQDFYTFEQSIHFKIHIFAHFISVFQFNLPDLLLQHQDKVETQDFWSHLIALQIKTIPLFLFKVQSLITFCIDKVNVFIQINIYFSFVSCFIFFYRKLRIQSCLRRKRGYFNEEFYRFIHKENVIG